MSFTRFNTRVAYQITQEVSNLSRNYFRPFKSKKIPIFEKFSIGKYGKPWTVVFFRFINYFFIYLFFAISNKKVINYSMSYYTIIHYNSII